MVDALKQMFARIYAIIPQQILDAAFETYNTPVALDDAIMQKVILARVRDDISLRGGKPYRIVLQINWQQYTSSPSPYSVGIAGAFTTYKIPPEAREHRDISAIMQVRRPYVSMYPSQTNPYNSCSTQGNTLNSIASAALKSQTGAGTVPSPQGLIMPGNVIRLTPAQFSFLPWEVMVRLRYDDNFSGMDVSEVYPFIQLCEQAIKAYIYTKLIFSIESNFVYRGMDLGVMKDIVSGYADANDKYDELIIAHGGSTFYEPERLRNILQSMVPIK